jgi:hypothetical protein
MATPQNETIPDQWQSQILARILMRHRVIFVTRAELADTVRALKMEFAPTLEDALRLARQLKATTRASPWIPSGVSVIVKKANAG